MGGSGRLAFQGFDEGVTPAERRRVLVVLAIAVLAISSSAVLVRGMRDAEPLAIAAWRTLGAALLLAPGIDRDLSWVGRRELVGIALAGLALAAHFGAWFSSLDHTTVLRSTLMVSTVPLWSALLEWLATGRAPHRGLWIGLAVALPGVALMSAAGAGGRATLLGDGLALLAGFLWAVYAVIGRMVRQRVPVVTTTALVCAVATVPLWPAAWLAGHALTGYAPTTWLLLAGAVLGPQLVGHQGATYAVKYLPASTVSAAMLLEPVGATALAAVVLGEVPGPLAAVGGAIVLLGVFLSVLGPGSAR